MLVFPSTANTTRYMCVYIYLFILPYRKVIVQDDKICIVRGDAYTLTKLKDA